MIRIIRGTRCTVSHDCHQRPSPHREPGVEGGDAAGAVLGEARRQLVLQARRGIALDAELQVLDRRQVAAHRRQGRVRDCRGRRDARRAACACGQVRVMEMA